MLDMYINDSKRLLFEQLAVLLLLLPQEFTNYTIVAIIRIIKHIQNAIIQIHRNEN